MILNVLLKQLVSDTVFTSKVYIVQNGFNVSSMCATCR
jgi:hypothetical protein